MQQFAILCFHGVGAPPRDRPADELPYWLTKKQFHAILDVAAADRSAWLTFDDGFASDIDTALPALLRRGLTATFFPVTGRFGRAGSLTPTAVRELRAAGMRVGSHGRDHISWRGLSVEQCQSELVAARRELEDVIGEAVDSAACPYGAYDFRILKALRRHGYREVFTTDRAYASTGSWLQPRFTITGCDSPASVGAILDHRPGRLQRVTDALRVTVKALRL